MKNIFSSINRLGIRQHIYHHLRHKVVHQAFSSFGMMQFKLDTCSIWTGSILGRLTHNYSVWSHSRASCYCADMRAVMEGMDGFINEITQIISANTHTPHHCFLQSWVILYCMNVTYSRAYVSKSTAHLTPLPSPTHLIFNLRSNGFWDFVYSRCESKALKAFYVMYLCKILLAGRFRANSTLKGVLLILRAWTLWRVQDVTVSCTRLHLIQNIKPNSISKQIMLELFSELTALFRATYN